MPRYVGCSTNTASPLEQCPQRQIDVLPAPAVTSRWSGGTLDRAVQEIPRELITQHRIALRHAIVEQRRTGIGQHPCNARTHAGER